MRRRVIVFGLSANPPTGWSGHAGIVRFAARHADEVWIVPVFRHAFNEKRGMTSYEHRRAMAKLAFEQIPGAKVIDTERDLSLRSGDAEGGFVGTIDVMRKLLADHPDTDFTLLLGADTYRDLAAGRWKESEVLRGLVPLMVVARTGVALDPAARARALEVPGLGPVSSSQVRASQDPAFLHDALQPEVLEYIRQHGLYAP